MPNHSDLKFRSRIRLHWMNMFTSVVDEGDTPHLR